MRILDDQRNLDFFVIESEAVGPTPVLEKFFAVVRGQDDHRRLVQVEALELVDQRFDERFIRVADFSVVEGDEVLSLARLKLLKEMRMAAAENLIQVGAFPDVVFPQEDLAQRRG